MPWWDIRHLLASVVRLNPAETKSEQGRIPQLVANSPKCSLSKSRSETSVGRTKPRQGRRARTRRYADWRLEDTLGL